MALPEFTPPMLSKIGSPFDSDEHLFEIKWDGIRALASIEMGGYRLQSRRASDLFPRYPELAFLADFEPGLVLDGELVVLKDGLPDFSAVLRREQARSELRIQSLARSTPVTYVVFDVLYRRGESLMDLELLERREELEKVVSNHEHEGLVLSEGIVGGGTAYFDEVSGLGFEGVIAKHVESTYLAGKRSDAWTKIKPVRHMYCAIMGYVPDGEDDLKSLIVATDDEGTMRCVGKVGSGLTVAMRRRLKELLWPRRCDEPLVECDIDGSWVEPGLYCTVSFLERTRKGTLRGPVFIDLVSE